MKVSTKIDGCIINMHAGIIDERLKFIIAITNTTNKLFDSTNKRDTLYNFKLKTDDNIHKIDSEIGLAMSNPFQIKPEETLYHIIEPYTLDEAEKEADDWNDKAHECRATTDIEEYKSSNDENIVFIPHVCVKRDKNEIFTAIFTLEREKTVKDLDINIKFDVFTLLKNMEMKFKLSELETIPHINELYDNPRELDYSKETLPQF